MLVWFISLAAPGKIARLGEVLCLIEITPNVIKTERADIDFPNTRDPLSLLLSPLDFFCAKKKPTKNSAAFFFLLFCSKLKTRPWPLWWCLFAVLAQVNTTKLLEKSCASASL